jgi:hypothetical protein
VAAVVVLMIAQGAQPDQAVVVQVVVVQAGNPPVQSILEVAEAEWETVQLDLLWLVALV